MVALVGIWVAGALLTSPATRFLADELKRIAPELVERHHESAPNS